MSLPIIELEGGTERTVAWKVTVTVSPGAIFGIVTPSAGCAPDC
ncbi:cell surface domain protein [Bacillus cereus]|nr:cell surface domain protein [Bacillus cereus]